MNIHVVFTLMDVRGEQLRMSVLCVLHPLAVFAPLATYFITMLALSNIVL